MSDPKRLAAADAPYKVIDESFTLPNGITISLSRAEAFTHQHQSISTEVAMVAIEQAKASRDVAQFRYAVPAQQQTQQVITISVAIVLVVGGGITGAILAPAAAAAIAGMVSVIGIVFGGVYYVTKKPEKDD